MNIDGSARCRETVRMLLMKCAELKEKVQKSRKSTGVHLPGTAQAQGLPRGPMRLALFEEVKRGGCR